MRHFLMNQKYLPSSVHLLRNVNVKADLYQDFSKKQAFYRLTPSTLNLKQPPRPQVGRSET